MVNIDQFIKKAEDEFLERWKRGPTRLTWTSLPPQVGEKAPNLKLQDFEGNWVELNDFWEEKPTVILFWRHFGCGCGLDRAKRLQEEYKEYITNGANVVIIGGITVSLLNFSSVTGLDEGNIDTITMGDRKLNYFYDDNFIVYLRKRRKF